MFKICVIGAVGGSLHFLGEDLNLWSLMYLYGIM